MVHQRLGRLHLDGYIACVLAATRPTPTVSLELR
jgi:hypothetical protein